MSPQPTKLALVGLGKIAIDEHVPSITASPTFDLVATVSRNAALPDLPAYQHLDGLLAARNDIHAVALCVPPQVRFDYARQALSAGCHVLLEKPPGATLSEVEALRRLAEDADRVLFATWHSRFARAVGTARTWLSGHRVERAGITWHEDVRHWHPGQQWIWDPGGFGVFDPGINALSILTDILAEPVRVTAAELDIPANRETPIAARLVLRGADGLRVDADFDWRRTGPQTWTITADTPDGRLTLVDGGARVDIDGIELAVDGPPASEYDGIYARFAELLATGQSDVDVAPLTHVADAFLIGRRITTGPFDD